MEVRRLRRLRAAEGDRARAALRDRDPLRPVPVAVPLPSHLDAAARVPGPQRPGRARRPLLARAGPEPASAARVGARAPVPGRRPPVGGRAGGLARPSRGPHRRHRPRRHDGVLRPRHRARARVDRALGAAHPRRASPPSSPRWRCRWPTASAASTARWTTCGATSRSASRSGRASCPARTEELSKANDQLRERTRELADASRAKSPVRGQHEPRDPHAHERRDRDGVAAAEHRRSPPEQRDYVDTIGSSGRALLRIIDDILDFSKIESGHLALESVDLVPRQLVAEVIRLFAPLAKAKGLDLAATVEDGVAHVLRGDPGRLRQALVNLVGNAVKFTEQGQVTVRVRVEAEPTQPSAAAQPAGAALRGARHRHRHRSGRARPAVPALRAGGRIDHPALRRHRPRPRHLQAAGRADGRPARRDERARRGQRVLVHGAARALGAHRALRSPAARDGRRGRRRRRRARSAGRRRSPRAAVAPVPPTRGRLLVAEDNIVNQKVAARILERLGYEVDVAATGDEAVAAARRQTYAAILMDGQMPQHGRVRGHPHHPRAGRARGTRRSSPSPRAR